MSCNFCKRYNNRTRRFIEKAKWTFTDIVQNFRLGQLLDAQIQQTEDEKSIVSLSRVDKIIWSIYRAPELAKDATLHCAHSLFNWIILESGNTVQFGFII